MLIARGGIEGKRDRAAIDLGQSFSGGLFPLLGSINSRGMEAYLILAILTVAGLLLTMLKFVTLRFVLRYAHWIDLVVTLFFMWFLAGSVTGIATAIFIGFLLAILLTLARWIADKVGYEYKSYSVIDRIKQQPILQKFRRSK